LLPKKLREFFKCDRHHFPSRFRTRHGEGHANELGDSMRTLPSTVRLEDKS
jgi:hypothetical protein